MLTKSKITILLELDNLEEELIQFLVVFLGNQLRYLLYMVDLITNFLL